ncbi:MAG: cache domain-containing protein [Spirochaetota bacterium]|nr:cache domain-containing protein [Spirochaetota bacterium]
MKYCLKKKIVSIFTVIIIMTGSITAVVGTFLIRKGIIDQVQDKLQTDLNTAREVLQNRMLEIKNSIYFCSLKDSLKKAIILKDKILMKECLKQLEEVAKINIATVTDNNGVVLFRAHNPESFGDNQSKDEIISKVKSMKKIIASSVIISKEELIKDGANFAKQANIKLIVTPKTKKIDKHRETSGLIIKVAAPVWGDKGKFLGIIYGIDLINRNYSLVDKIKKIVFRNEENKNMSIATVTIFLNDLRISTNLMTKNGERAIGTRVSEEVYNKVLIEGKQWVGRAFVLNKWFITAYEPIRDFNNKILGMLSVGLIEKKSLDMIGEALLIFFGLTFLGMILVLIVSNFFANKITKPINYLAIASKKISEGDFSVKVDVKSKDELGELETAFNAMAIALQEHDKKLEIETQKQLMRSEKLAALGRMAAGVAHEINNPLTGVLMYGHILLKNLPEKSRDWNDVEIIVKETTRCREIIKNLLNFSRESTPHKEPANINTVIEDTIAIIEHQVYFENVNIIKELSENIPEIEIDINQIEQVLVNLALNAAEAMTDGGNLTIQTKLSGNNKNIIVKITDEGNGIPKNNIDMIFDPFFTTKEIGKGTGLGLAVSYGIIKRHNGQIIVDSELNVGTTFTIILPI